jgi:hypothetical protein
LSPNCLGGQYVLRLSPQILVEDAKSIGHRLLMHKEDEQHIIVDLKEDKVDVHDKQVPEEEDNRIRLTNT